LIQRLAPSNPLVRWVSTSGVDAVGRIVLQVGATVLFARWLSPEIFGQASLTGVLVGLLIIFSTAPFEEALTQRKIIQSAHFASSLAIVLAIALFGCLLVAGLWLTVDFTGESATIAGLVVGFSVIGLAEAPISIYTALARRHNAFTRVAWSNLIGQIVGTVVGLSMAYNGVGVWSLLAVRLVARFLTLVLLMAASPVRIVPGFSMVHVRELSGFAGWTFGNRVVSSISDAVFQGLVSKFFGLAGVGYLNMALRIIEPVRGATFSIGHNISMSFFVRAQNAPEKLRGLVEQTVAGTAMILLPVFIGLAAAGSSIIAVIAGPGWSESSVLVVCLALGAAVTCSTNFLQTALIAKGRADLGFKASSLELIVMVTSLWLLSGWGLVAAGLARLIAFAADALYSLFAARSELQLGIFTSARLITPLALSTATMGLIVFYTGQWPPLSDLPLPRLLAQIAVGVAIYGVFLVGFHRGQFRDILQQLRSDD